MYAPFKDSHVTYTDYAKRAVELGHGILSCAEHGYQGNHLRVYETAKKYNLKFVFGAEAYWVDDHNDTERTHPNAHICIFAKNQEGFYELTNALSYAQEHTFWRVPRFELKHLLTLNPENIFITTACIGYWGRVNGLRVQSDTGNINWHPNHVDNFVALRNHFGNSIALEVQAHNTPWQKELNRFILELSHETTTPIIAGMDSHYIFPEQREERQTLRDEAGVGKIFDDEHEFDDGVYEDYPDRDTFVMRFKEQGVLDNSQIESAINLTNIFLEFGDIEFSKEKKLPSLYKDETQEQRNERYRQILRDGWREYEKYTDPKDRQKYMEAIAYEADVITETGFSDYFLINHEIIRRGREKGARVTFTSRGSGSSYFTNTLIGLSTIDRITLPVELYPERFVSRARLLAGQLPDVDINTSDQDILEEAQEEVLGKGHAYPMVAYGTLQHKSAFRMYARAAGLDVAIQDEVAKQITRYELAVKYAEEDEKDTIDIEDYVDSQYIRYIEDSKAYLGIIVSKSKAPCSYLLYDGDIKSEIGLMRIISSASKTFSMCTVIDGYTADDFGYVKNDLLQVDTVRLSAMAYENMGIPQPNTKELIELTRDNRETWEVYEKGATLGVNQCEKAPTIVKLQQYKPKNLAELSAFVAAIRPGFKSMINDFLARRKFSYNIPSLDSLLQGEYMKSSWLLYQEQVMKILSFAGFEMDSTYATLKAISKKRPEQIMKIKPQFMEGFKKRVIKEDGVSEEIATASAESAWHIIEDSSAYSFNACLSGDTVIARPGGHRGPLPTVQEMFYLLTSRKWARENGRLSLYEKYNSPTRGIGYGLSLDEDNKDKVILNDIVDVRFAGIQEIYRVKLRDGKHIDCTMNHKFPTPRGLLPLSELSPGSALYIVGGGTPQDKYLQKKKRRQWLSVGFELIESIEFLREDRVYDVEMKAPYHTFATTTGIITSNSHSVAVALDGLYCAYVKGNDPMSFYLALLEVFQSRKDKDKIALAKDEMFRIYGIKTVPCRFRQDNRGFYADRKENTISDALSSMKGVSVVVARTLYQARNMSFNTFIDLLYWMTVQTPINTGVQLSLIKTDYFAEFGDRRTLEYLYREFHFGKGRFDKAHIMRTQETRLAALRKKEKIAKCLELEKVGIIIGTGQLKDGDEIIDITEQLKFETTVAGSPLSTYLPKYRLYTVVEVNAKPRTPMVTLYSTGTGVTATVRIPKQAVVNADLEKGDSIIIERSKKKPAGRYVDGAFKRDGTTELWVEKFSLVSLKDKEKIEEWEERWWGTAIPSIVNAAVLGDEQPVEQTTFLPSKPENNEEERSVTDGVI